MSDYQLTETDKRLGRVISQSLADLTLALARESERAAVVLGAAQLDASLLKLVRGALHHNPKKGDELFGKYGPLGSFSSRIEMAYRLNLIELETRDAINHIRRIRNSFAHHVDVASLSDQPHVDRLDHIDKLIGFDFRQQFLDFMEELGVPKDQARYCTAVGDISLDLEVKAVGVCPVEVTYLPPDEQEAS